MENCIFCNIVKGEIPSYKVYEDENILAFLDINPVSDGHTLVIPKEHHTNLYEIPDELISKIFIATKKIAKSVKKVTGAGGINIINNNEKASGQEVFHYHAHIIPRFENDNLSHWPKKQYKESEAEQILEKIKSNI